MNRKLPLNNEQAKAVQHKKGPILVIAGAGTGKTQVITYRIAEFLKSGVKPSEILAITFTDKAAYEMENRVVDLLGSYVPDLRITTFNAFGQEILERFAFEIGLGAPLSIINSIQKIVFMRTHFDKLGLEYYAPITKPDRFLVELASYFSSLKNELITPGIYEKFAKNLSETAKTESEELEAVRQQELAKAYKNFIELARRERVLDFDDQLYLAVELLQRRKNVLSKLQDEIKYILIDEFQDTNRVQNALINLVVGDRQNVMVVGDDDQSIYRFRGAAVANILGFKEQYPKAKQITLINNYRSSQEILDSAYRLIQHNNPNRLEAKYNVDKRLIAQFSGKNPAVRGFATREEEAAWVAVDIKKKLKAGYSPENVAILLRQNQQSRQLISYLENESISYQVVGQSLELFAQAEIKLLFVFMRTVSDTSDSTSLYHLLTSSIYSVSPLILADFSSKARRERQSLEKILKNALPELEVNQETSIIKKALDQIQAWRAQIHSLSVGKLCYLFLKDTDYIKKILKNAQRDPTSDLKIANLNRFFSVLLDFERVSEDSTVFGFLDNAIFLEGIDQTASLELSDLEKNKLRLLTVHKAKGLEFDVVYIFDLTQGTFPARKQGTMLEIPPALLATNVEKADYQTEEERRLMYVAMTRAKKELILTYSFSHGGAKLKKPSQFLNEAIEGFNPLSLKKPVSPTRQIDLFTHQTTSVNLTASPFLRGTKIVLSVRQIEDYLMCPAEFRLRHIVKPPQPSTFELEYGTLIHGAVQLYNRRKLENAHIDLIELLNFIENNWPTEGFMSVLHQKRGLEQAKKTIKRFFAREEETNRHPKYIEYPFWFNVGENAQVHGRFDAVYEGEEGVEIRDYKTGAFSVVDQEKAIRRTKESLQLGIYALAWRQLKKTAVQKVALDFLDSGFLGFDKRSERSLQTIQQKVEKAINGIATEDFKPGSSHIFCSHMEYGF